MLIFPAIMQHLNWDDLRVLLAIARAESFGGASNLLNLDATTVSRRIKAMEKRAGEALINRDRSGRSQLTQIGQELVDRAEQMEQHAHAADGRRVFVVFPRGIVQGEMPPLFVLGADGSAELVNTRVFRNVLIVDRLFAAAELRLGGNDQQVVRIVRTDTRPRP